MKAQKGIKGFLTLFLTTLFFGNCSTPEDKIISYRIEDLPLDSVPSEIWFPESFAINTNHMVSMQDMLCLVRPNENESLVYFIDEKTGKEIGYFGGVGQGPADMYLPQFAGKSSAGDTIILHDFNARNFKAFTIAKKDTTLLFKFAYKKQIAHPEVDGASCGFDAICRLDNGYYVCIAYLGVDKFYTLLDKDLNTVTVYGDYPLREFGEDKKALKEHVSFQGTLASHGNSAFYGATRFGYMSRYDISDEGVPELVWEHTYSDIDYRVSNNGVKFQEKNVYGFSHIAVTDKYIFATFSGIRNRKMFEERSTYAVSPKTLVVLNHDGVPLGRFKLNSRCHSVAVSGDGEYLYIQDIDPEDQIERIRMKDILEKLRE
jgi:hypothetical protein